MKPHYHVRVNRDMREDLQTWLQFLNEPTVYCRPFLDYSKVLMVGVLDWYTDASGVIGCSGICGQEFFQQRWPQNFIKRFNPSIEFLELYAVCASVLLWAKKFTNKRVCIFVDNESCMRNINSATSGCKHSLILIRKIILECMTWNVRLFALHVRSAKNNFADALSRFQNTRFWSDAKKENRTFVLPSLNVPSEIWPPQKCMVLN